MTVTVKKKQESSDHPGGHEHSFGTWITTSKATVFESEQQRRICTGCNKTETRSVGKKLTPTIKLNAAKFPLQVRKSTTALKVSGLADGDYIKSWESSRKKIAVVNKNGKITAKKVGKTKITITLASGKKASVSVTVQRGKVKTSKIKLPKKSDAFKRKKHHAKTACQSNYFNR